jgi:hypothetical protein
MKNMKPSNYVTIHPVDKNSSPLVQSYLLQYGNIKEMKFFLEEGKQTIIVKYSSISEAINAKSAMDGMEINGYIIEVCILYDPNLPTSTVIPELVSEDDIEENEAKSKKKEPPSNAPLKSTPMTDMKSSGFIRNSKQPKEGF